MWGGCVSCEQYFMFPGKHQSCCNKSGQCQRPGKTPTKSEKRDCNRLPLNRGDNAHPVPMLAIVPYAVANSVPPAVSAALLRAEYCEAVIEPSPPDRQALHATFLI